MALRRSTRSRICCAAHGHDPEMTAIRGDGSLRRQTDHLYVTPLGPRERDALELIEQRPGITVAELRDALGVGRARIWQIMDRLQRPRIRCDSNPVASAALSRYRARPSASQGHDRDNSSHRKCR